MSRGRCAALMGMLLVLCIGRAAPQVSYSEEANDDPRGNVHLGAPIVIPLNPTAKAVHLGFGLNVGGGYNFTRQHAAVGEFLWNDLFPTNEALAKLRLALNDPKLDASVHLTALTGNYRFELR